MRNGDIVLRRYQIDRMEGEYGIGKLFQAMLGFFICAIGIFKLLLSVSIGNWRNYTFQLTIIGLFALLSLPAYADVNSGSNQVDSEATSIQADVGNVQNFATTSVEIDTKQFEENATFSSDNLNEEFNIEENLVVAQATIPTIRLNNSAIFVNENVSGGMHTITAILSHSVSTPVTFEYALFSGATNGATKGVDFTEPTVTDRLVEFSVGETRQTFSFPIINDHLWEQNESYRIRLSNPVGATIAPGWAEVIMYIRNDDPPGMSLTNTTLNFAENATNTSLEFSFTPALTTASSFRVTTSTPDGNTATSVTDFQAIANERHPVNNVSTYSVPFTIINDGNIETSETFTITISNLVNLRFSDGTNTKSFTITIIDDDDTTKPIISVPETLVVDENVDGGKLEVVVSLSRPFHENITLSYFTSQDTDDNEDRRNSDFGYMDTNLTFPLGETEKTIEIEIIDDQVREVIETFSITVFNVVGSKAQFPNNHRTDGTTVKIVDDDTPQIDISVSSFLIAENAGSFSAKFSISETITQAFSFIVAVSDGSAILGTDYTLGTDFSNRQKFIQFSSGTKEVSFSIPIVDNETIGTSKDLTIILKSLRTPAGLSTPVTQFANGESSYSKTVTIVDDESTSLSIVGGTSLSVPENESGNEYTVNVRLSQVTLVPVTFDYALSDTSSSNTSATKGTDYTEPTNRTVTIAAGTQDGSFTIPIINDTGYELNEEFNFTIRNLVGAKSASDHSQGTITITNDDPPPELSVTNTSFSFSEDDDDATLDITFTPALTVASSFNVTMSKLSGDNAVANSDFSAITNFKHDVNSGSSTYSVRIGLIDNILLNSGADKTFTITISDLVNLKFSDNAPSKPYTITITDDEKILPKMSISNTYFSFAENDDTSSLNLEFTKGISLPASIQVATTNGPTGSSGAVSGTDFNISQLPIPIASGTGTTYSIPLGIIDDANVEVNETFTITISSLVNLEFADGESSKSFTITIVDDDTTTPPTISVEENYTVVENVEGDKLAIDMILSRPYHQDINIHYYTQHGTASTSDFTRIGFETNTMVSFKLGETRKTVEITILDDVLPEVTKNFTVIFNSSNSIKFLNNSVQFTTTVKIVDDDSTKIGFAASSFYVAENGGTFNVKFNISRAADVTFDLTVSDGTAILNTDFTLGSDFTNRQRQVRFTTGNSEASVSIPITDNNITSANKNFIISVSNISVDIIQFTGGESQLSQTVTIVDDESTNLSIVSGTSHTVAENVPSENYTVNVRLSQATLVPVTFDYALADITTTKGTDYTEPTNRSLTIAAGSRDGSFTIPIRDDTAYEADEEFSFSITNLVGAKSASGQSQGTIVITNDDSKPTISASNITIAENDPNPTLDITFDKEVVLESSFNVTTSTPSNTAVSGTDFRAISNVRQPFNNVSTYSIRLDLIDNDDINSGPNKTFTVTLSSLVNVQFSDNSTTKSFVITIVDDDATELSISNSNFDVGEEDSNFVVSVSLTSTHEASVSFKYAFEDIEEEAVKGVDYTEVAENQRTVTIPAGTNRGSFSIPIISDPDYEGNEKFRLVLSELVGANFSTGSTISQEITILDDEGPTIEFVVADIRVNEDIQDGEVEVKVKLSGPASHPFRVQYSTNAISISSSIGFANVATSVSDFTRVLSRLDVGADVTEATFKVNIVDDNLHELNEFFVVELHDVSDPSI